MHSNCMGSPGYEKYNFSVKSPGQLLDLADHLYSSGLNSIARHRFKLYWLGFAEQSKKRERFSLSPTAVLKSIACNSKPVSYVIPESTPCFLPGDHRPQGDPQGLLSPWPCSMQQRAKVFGTSQPWHWRIVPAVWRVSACNVSWDKAITHLWDVSWMSQVLISHMRFAPKASTRLVLLSGNSCVVPCWNSEALLPLLGRISCFSSLCPQKLMRRDPPKFFCHDVL